MSYAEHKTMPTTTDTRPAYAWVWATGAIEIAVLTGRSRPPRGAIVIAKAPAAVLDAAIAGLARLAYDNETLLVPGIPEASDEAAKLEALTTFRARVAAAIARRQAAH